jgi:hypothetical protein
MGPACQPESKPDVEAIVAEIRDAIRVAGAESGPVAADPATDEDSLYGNLAAANAQCRIAPPAGRGVKAVVGRLLLRALAPALAPVNRFNAHVVRVLNKLVMALDGRDTEAAGALLKQARQRQDLIVQLSNRLAAYDALRVEERLRGIEERIERLEGRSPPQVRP